MKKHLLLIPVILLILTGCGNIEGNSIAVGGSTSVQPLMKDIITDYMSENLDLNITYDGQGSSAGITGVIDGKYQVGTSSRELKKQEVDSGVTADVLAMDGIVIVLNAENPVNDLSIEEIYKIYTGEIVSWAKLGGAEQQISVIARDGNSGTREGFEEKIGFAGQMTRSALELSSNGEVTATVQSNKNAIGYASLGEVDPTDERIKIATVDGITPNSETILEGSYSVSRRFLMVYEDEYLTENSKKMISWISENKEHYAKEFGYVPVLGENNET